MYPMHRLRIAVLSSLTAFALLAVPASGLSFAATFSEASAFASGSGTRSNPYAIDTADQLIRFDDTASGTANHYVLGAPINMTGYTGWTPVTSFSGTFNGVDPYNAITGLTTNTLVNDSAIGDVLGMFGDVTSSGVVEAVTLKDWQMNNSSSTSVIASGLVAYNAGTVIYNTVINASLTTAAMDYAGVIIGQDASALPIDDNHVQSTTLTDNASNVWLGGIAGEKAGGFLGNNTVESSTFSSNGSSSYAEMGAIVGHASNVPIKYALATQDTFNASESSNPYVGGIAGATIDSSISGSLATGITITGGGIDGGFVGNAQGSGYTLTDNQALSTITTNDNNAYVGGFVGEASNGLSMTNDQAQGSITIGSNASNSIVGGFSGYTAGTTASNIASNVAITMDGASGGAEVGGLLGYNTQSVTTANAMGPITITGSVHSAYIGNLVGYSYSSGALTNVSATSQMHLPNSITNSEIGGLIGHNHSIIQHALAVTQDQLAAIPTGNYVGALVGHNLGSITHAYWDTTSEPDIGAIPSVESPIGATGLTTDALVLGPNPMTTAWTKTTDPQTGISAALPFPSGLTLPPRSINTPVASTPFVANSTQATLTATVFGSDPQTLTTYAIVSQLNMGLPVVFTQTHRSGPDTAVLGWTNTSGIATVIAPALPTLPSVEAEAASVGTQMNPSDASLTPQANPTHLTLQATPSAVPNTIQVTATVVFAYPPLSLPATPEFHTTLNGTTVSAHWTQSTSTNANQLTETTTLSVYGGPNTLSVGYTDPTGLTASSTDTIPVSTTPAAPSGLTVSDVTDQGATLSWPAVRGATQYAVQVNQNPVLTVYSTNTALTLTPASQSQVTVKAVYSTQASLPLSTVITTPPTAVTTLQVTPGSAGSGQATATWTAVYGATGYWIAVNHSDVLGYSQGPVQFTRLPLNASVATTIQAVYNNVPSAPESVTTFIPGAATILPPAPDITQVTPTTATTGSTVTLQGTHFGTQGVLTLQQGTITLTVQPTSWTATQIVFTVPKELAVGTAHIQVMNPTTQESGTASLAITAPPGPVEPPLTFTPPPAPNITQVTPTTASAGTTVTLRGTAFGTQGVLTLQQGAIMLTVQPTSWAGTQIVFTVPKELAVGTAQIQVTANTTQESGTASLTITAPSMPPAPHITQVSPMTVDAGTTVTLQGTHFGTQGVLTLQQGTITLTVQPTSWTATQIVFTVPKTFVAGLAHIQITNNSTQESGTATLIITGKHPSPHSHSVHATLPPSTSHRLVLASHTKGALIVSMPIGWQVAVNVSQAPVQATSIAVHYLPGVPAALPNIPGLEVFQVSVTNPLAPAQRITWLPATDRLVIHWMRPLSVGTTLQRWDVHAHRWIIMARVTQAHTTAMTAPLPHMRDMTYVLVPPKES